MGSQNSPIYLYLKEQYISYGDIVKRTNTAEPLFKKNGAAFEKMFGGVLKRKEKISNEDIELMGPGWKDEFDETKRLANELEAILTSIQEDFAKVPSLDQFLRDILERSGKIAELQKELGKQVSSFSREVERNRKSTQAVESEFKDFSTWLIKYPFFKEGDKIREQLLSMQSEYTGNQTNLENIHKQIRHFLSGVASPGEEETVWESFDVINEERVKLLSSLDASPAILEAQREKLEQVNRNMEDFRKEVTDARDDLDKRLRFFTREVEKNYKAAKKMEAQFIEVSAGIETYPIFSEGDLVREQLMSQQDEYNSYKDSLKATLAHIDRFLAGKTEPEEGQNARKTLDDIKNKQTKLETQLEAKPEVLEQQREKLDDLIKLIAEFKDVLEDMETGIASLDVSIREEEAGLMEDSLRYIALMVRIPAGFPDVNSPYLELTSSFSDIAIKLDASRKALIDLRTAREDLISHVATMDGVKNNAEKYDRFKQLQKDFSEANKTGEKRLKELDDTIEAHRQVILDNFLNTPEYWALLYEVEFKSSRKGDVLAENYGFLLDMNRFTAEKYHGHLVSDFQLKLVKKGKLNPEFEFAFSGEYNFPIEGFKIVSSDGTVLMECIRDSIPSKSEDVKDEGLVSFEWNVSVPVPTLARIVDDPNHSFRIQFVTIGNRVNLTGYTTKMYREYRIPQVRLDNWIEIAGLTEPAS